MESVSCPHPLEALHRQTSASTKNLPRRESSSNLSFDEMMLRMEAEGFLCETSVLSRRSSSTRSHQGTLSDAGSIFRTASSSDARCARHDTGEWDRLSSLPERPGGSSLDLERAHSGAMAGYTGCDGDNASLSTGANDASSRHPYSDYESSPSRSALIKKTELTVNNILVTAGAVGKLTERPQPAWKAAEFDAVEDLALFRNIDVLEDTRHRPSSSRTPSRSSSRSSLQSALLMASAGGGQGFRRRPSEGSSSSGVTHSIVQNILNQDAAKRQLSAELQKRDGSLPRSHMPTNPPNSTLPHPASQPSGASVSAEHASLSHLQFPSVERSGDFSSDRYIPVLGSKWQELQAAASAAMETPVTGSSVCSDDQAARASVSSDSYLWSFMDKIPASVSPFAHPSKQSSATFRSVASILSERAPQLESCSMRLLMKTSSTAFGPYPFSSEDGSPTAATVPASCHSSVATRGSVLHALRCHRGGRIGAAFEGSSDDQDDLAARRDSSLDSEDSSIGVLPLTANSLVLHDKVNQRNPTKEAFWDRFWSNIGAEECEERPAAPPRASGHTADRAAAADSPDTLQQFARNLMKVMTDTHAGGHTSARSLLLRRDSRSFRRAYTDYSVSSRDSVAASEAPSQGVSQSMHSRRWTSETPPIARSPLASTVFDERSICGVVADSSLFRASRGFASAPTAETQGAEGADAGGGDDAGALISDMRLRTDLESVVLGTTPGASQPRVQAAKPQRTSSWCEQGAGVRDSSAPPQRAVELHSLLDSGRRSVDALCPELQLGAGVIVVPRDDRAGNAKIAVPPPS